MTNVKVDPHKCQVLVLSYDGFSDIWPIFFDRFFNYWPDCPFEINLITNFKEYSDPKVKSLKIGKDDSWSDGVSKALHKIDAERVLFFFEDHVFDGSVDTSEILDYYNLAIENNSDSFRLGLAKMRLRPRQFPKRGTKRYVVPMEKGSMYRVGLNATFFKKTTILALLDEKESAWECEFNGTVRSDAFENFHASGMYIIPIKNLIVKGMWQKEVLPIIANYNIDPNVRGIYEKSKMDKLYEIIMDMIFKFIPSQYERPVYFFFRAVYLKVTTNKN